MSGSRVAEQNAFTLIELLVVIAILAILMSLSITVVTASRKRALEATTISRLRQLHLAFEMYALDNDFEYPRFYSQSESSPKIWQERIAPYIGITDWNAEDQIKRRAVFNSPYQEQGSGDPAYWQVGRSFGVNSFMAHPEWAFNTNRILNPTQILLIGDMVQANSDFVNTADGSNTFGSGADWALPAYRHTRNRALFVFCDGHVESLTEEQLRLRPPDSNSRWIWW